MSNVFKIHITTKTLSVFALTAILFGSFAPNIFAMTAEEETELSKNLEINLIRSPVTRDVNPSIAGHVDLELQLLVDISGSVDATEFALQRDGYEAAFRDNSVGGVIDKIESSPNCIAVQYVNWSAFNQQQVMIDWTKLCNQADSEAFADLIDLVGRPFGSSTAPGSAINFGVPLFGTVYTSDHQVIDVSGDGIENNGADTSDARDAAVLSGIDTINGIFINSPSEDPADLQAFYENDVVGGTNPFAIEATNFADFEPAIARKIIAEIDPCQANPENCNPPTTVGGESLNINTTSLLVAGLVSNVLWIAPVAAGIAGTGLYLARSKIK
jgi:hypothetical protein